MSPTVPVALAQELNCSRLLEIIGSAYYNDILAQFAVMSQEIEVTSPGDHPKLEEAPNEQVARLKHEGAADTYDPRA